MIKREDIRIRDPFILADEVKKTYYMYGTTAFTGARTFSVYVSRDLVEFEGPYIVFDGAETSFWGTEDFWAPEVHKYNGKYYLFGSFKAKNHVRATQILVSDSPLGPFAPLSNHPVTPANQECLDGTLWIENGVPYCVYCHEWVQTYNGEICAVKLSSDLKQVEGEPVVLFKASENPFVSAFAKYNGNDCYVTDGPFLFNENGKLNMIWSSFIDGKYAVLHSEADELLRKWTHLQPWLSEDGGHAMLFTDFNGVKRISFHTPNNAPLERAVFIEKAKVVLK